MSHKEFQYQRIFQVLKNKIESGSIPQGSSLPSCAKLCKEYAVSAKTMRRVLSMLSDGGLIETSERKRAIAINQPSPAYPSNQLKEPNPVAIADIVKTAELLCYPLISRGVSLCCGTDWLIPEQLIDQMNPEQPALFWRKSKLFWRFFIARCENELALRILDSLGFEDLEYLNDTTKLRTAYRERLLHFIKKFRVSGCARDAVEKLLADVYDLTPISANPLECAVPPSSPLRTGIQSNEQWLKTAEEQYSAVCLDILGLISVGHYRAGAQLPSHTALQKQYGVSVFTTLQAIKTLKQWGVVETTRGKGIFVSQHPPMVDELPISTQLIASYTKRYLENIELLALTAEGVAFYVAQSVSPAQAQALQRELFNSENIRRKCPSASITILEFLTAHIPYKAMRAVYAAILENHRIGIKIPGLASVRSSSQKQEIASRCIGSVAFLIRGDASEFAKQVGELFRYVQQLVITECDKLNYLNAVKAIYDTSQLWR